MATKKTIDLNSKRVGVIRTVETPLGFFVLVVLVIEAIFGIASSFCPDPQRSWLIAAMIILIFCLIAIVAFLAYFRPEALRGQRGPDSPLQSNEETQRLEVTRISSVAVEPAVSSKDKETATFMKRGYPRSQHPEFFSEVEKIVPHAKRIKLVATGLNLIWEKHILDMMLQRAQTGDAEVTICLGNPYSPHVEDRLIEEEIGDNRPPVGREGIIKSAEALVERLARAGNPTNFKVLLFEHYPTFATLIFDDEIFIYPYAYQVLGNLSPIFHLIDDGGEVANFFVRNVTRIITDAVPARDVLLRRKTSNYFSDSWIAAAVYIVPEENDAFYRLGSEILGYDIRKGQIVECGRFEKLRPYVGVASEFGFHATLADALYFATQSEINRVEAELRMLAKDFCPFLLSGLCIVDGIDERGDIVIGCEDLSGTLEALHHEIVNRVYKTAISSYYTSVRNREPFVTEKERHNLMIQRYGAPFILNRYRPHFTLMSNPPQDVLVRTEVLNIIENAAGQFVSKQIKIHELALVTKAPKDTFWRICETFQLIKK
jgi:hypothetical protein